MIYASHPVEISPDPAKEAHWPRFQVHTPRLAEKRSEQPIPVIAVAETLSIVRFVRMNPLFSFCWQAYGGHRRRATITGWSSWLMFASTCALEPNSSADRSALTDFQMRETHRLHLRHC